MIVPFGLVSFTMENVAVGPCQDVSGLLQLASVSAEVFILTTVDRPVAVGSSGSTVNVAFGVNVAEIVGLVVSVGGLGVLVGIASSVCATFVNAAASAVCCTSNGLTVGAAWAVHALMIKTRATLKVNTFCFMHINFLLERE
jgi:hypothetical protein